MILDKRSIFASALLFGLGMAACDDDGEQVFCGDGVISGDEVCDIGLDGQPRTADDVIASGVTCSVLDSSKTYEPGGKPRCAANCMGYAKGKGEGVCEEVGVAKDVNGLLSCTASISADGSKATGTLTAETKAEGGSFSAGIFCASEVGKVEQIVGQVQLTPASAGQHSGEFDTSAFKTAGKYACVYFVKADGNNGVTVCKDGLKNASSFQTVSEASLASFEVQSSVSEDVLSKWTFMSYTKEAIQGAIEAGIAPDEGSEKSVKLTLVKNDASPKVVMTKGNDGGMTALQIQNSDTVFSEEHVADKGAHLEISDLSAYAISEMSIVMQYGKTDASVYVTASDGSSENLVSDGTIAVKGNADKAFATYKVTGIPANSKIINIYGDSKSKSALSIDELTLVGTK